MTTSTQTNDMFITQTSIKFSNMNYNDHNLEVFRLLKKNFVCQIASGGSKKGKNEIVIIIHCTILRNHPNNLL